jgi:prepilin-type N-terminal cleavage/methylation domain-containing protein
MKHEAFTLIELLMVIAILGLMSSLVLVNFGAARNNANLSVIGDQSVAMLQQARANVNAGHYDGDVFLCEGALFEVGEIPQLASARYGIESGACFEPSAEDYGVASSVVPISKITVGGLEVKRTWAFFTPPEAEVIFFEQADSSEVRQSYVGDAVVRFDNPSDSARGIELFISYLSNQISLSFVNDEN